MDTKPDSTTDSTYFEEGPAVGIAHDTVAVSSGGDGGEDGELTFVPKFEIQLGRTLVDDRDDGQTLTMWKAKASSGESNVSDEPFNAIMGLLERMTGGDI